jgi:hypothetical protein
MPTIQTLDLISSVTVDLAAVSSFPIDFGNNTRFTSSNLFPQVFKEVYNPPSTDLGDTYLYTQYGCYIDATYSIVPRRINAAGSNGSNVTTTWGIWDGYDVNGGDTIDSLHIGLSANQWLGAPFYTATLGGYSFGSRTIPANAGTSTLQVPFNIGETLHTNFQTSAGSGIYYPVTPPVFNWHYLVRGANGDLGVMGLWSTNVTAFSGYNYFTGYASRDQTVVQWDGLNSLVASSSSLDPNEIGEVYSSVWFDINRPTALTNTWVTPFKPSGGSDVNNPLVRVQFQIGGGSLDVLNTDYWLFDDAAINGNIGDQNASYFFKAIPAGFLMTFTTIGAGRRIIIIKPDFSGYYNIKCNPVDAASTSALASHYFTASSDKYGNLWSCFAGSTYLGAVVQPGTTPYAPSVLIPSGPTPPPPDPGAGGLPTPVQYTWHNSLPCLAHTCGTVGYQRANGY